MHTKSGCSDFLIKKITSSYMLAFWRKVITPSSDSCWVWSGSVGRDGYIRYSVKDVGTFYAHRLSYYFLVGEIPKGMTIDHLCRNRSCLNPRHLEVVPFHINARRGNCISSINRQKTHCIRGHKLSGKNLYIRKSGHRRCYKCNKMYRTRAHLKMEVDHSNVHVQM